MRFAFPPYGVLLFAVSAMSALAAPPPGADPKLAPWFESLKMISGGHCCGAADCREETRAVSPSNSADGHWHVFIGTDKFGADAPNQMVRVPDEVISVDDETTMPRPPGPVVCWHHFGYTSGVILCFRLPRASG
jgi:hypothetical protein